MPQPGSNHPGRRGPKYMWGPNWQFRHYSPEKMGEGGSKAIGSGYQQPQQYDYSQFRTPYYSYSGGGRYYNPIYIGLINWRI